MDSTASYGRHGNTLRPHRDGPEGRTGYAGWGQYENYHAEVGHGRGVTQATLDNIEMVKACLLSASILPAVLYRPRGQSIANCDTSEHNDRQRGDTISLFRWLEPERACLLIRTDVLFYISLVTFHGVSFLPICVHPPTRAGEEPKVMGYVWESSGRARELVINYSSIDTDAWQTVGQLEVLVCGIRDGQVLCCPRLDSDRYNETHLRSTVDAVPLSPGDAYAQAKCNPMPSFPAKWIGMGWDGEWGGLYGWAMIHALVGDGAVERVHLYTRMVDKCPVSVTRTREQLTEEDALSERDLMVANEWIGRLRPHLPR